MDEGAGSGSDWYSDPNVLVSELKRTDPAFGHTVAVTEHGPAGSHEGSPGRSDETAPARGDKHPLTVEAARRLVQFYEARGDTTRADEFRSILPP
jgi:hypothetical protein